MINFCVFKWKPEGKNILPSQKNVDYLAVGAAHVNKMFNMVHFYIYNYLLDGYFGQRLTVMVKILYLSYNNPYSWNND